MFLLLVAALIFAGGVHALRERSRRPGRTPELVLVYILAGYCGILQMVIACAMLVIPDRVATHVGVPPGNPIQIWTAFLLLGAGVIATLTVRLRGSYLIAPVAVWSIFFLGATYAHLQTDILNGVTLTAGRVAWTIVTHGLISLILISLLIAHRRAAAPASIT